ncbi:MAG: hypothetical protein H7255_05230 [Ramlibacter sp.]|nr:hypothetical protein [Ramlibacter sp.]
MTGLLLAAGILLPSSAAWAQSATQAELARKLDALAAELASVKAQLTELQKRQEQSAPAPAVTAASAPLAAPISTAAIPAAAATSASTVISSYGEINYNRPTRRSQDAQADLRRFVFGFQHRFDERTKLVTEVEVEHAVASAGDQGEVAIEQAYVERQLTPRWAARAGLFLMPVGLLNENHEPTAYYGVERNFVETAIIPSTWREGGVQFVGAFDNGLTVQGGLATSFDLTKWDATSTEGRESPLGAIHQELALARSRNVAVFGAVNWRGVPGLLVGGSLFTGGATHGQTPSKSRVTLWDVHARWTPGRWDFSTLYARGKISNTAALNTPLVGSPTLIPKTFDGFYAQAAYKLWSSGDMALSPFARWERFNTARSFADIGTGLTPDASPSERVVTVGANLQVTQGVVLKADYQRFRQNTDANRASLGLGWSF